MITVETTVNAPIETVWERWNNPEHITKWAFASDDWESLGAENDLRTGGRFKTNMSAKDKSASFDLTGTYTNVKEYEVIEYTMDGDDQRKVITKFETVPEGTKITQSFDPENENPEDFQKAGWQSILNNFKKYAES
jgi:uncharacterized protein YndB with AHSA1/START domain